MGRGALNWRSAVVFTAAAAVLTVVAFLVLHGSGAWLLDLKVYRNGGIAAWEGAPIYRDSPRPPFTYPPFAALVFMPLALFPLGLAGLVWTFVSLLCLLAAVRLCLDWAGVPGRGRTAVVLLVSVAVFWLDPVRTTLLLGQVNLLVLPVLVHELRGRGGRCQGAGIGVCAGIKIVPGALILYLLLTKRFRAAAVATGTFLATTAIGFAAKPGESARYWTSTLFDTTRVAFPQNIFSSSVSSVLARWLHTADFELVALVLSGVLAVGGLTISMLCHRKGQDLLGACLFLLTTTTVLPIGWIHYWTWVLPPLLCCLGYRAWHQRSAPLAAATLLIAANAYVSPQNLGVPRDYPTQLRLGVGDLLLSSTYFVLSVVIIVAAGFLVAREPRREP